MLNKWINNNFFIKFETISSKLGCRKIVKNAVKDITELQITYDERDERCNPARIYLFKVNNGNTWKRCEICSKLPIKTPEQRQWHCFVVFIVNFEHISQFFIVFLSWVWTDKCLLAGVLQNGCSDKFRKIHREAPAMEPFFSEVAALTLQLY